MRTAADNAISPIKMLKSSPAKQKKNEEYREYDVSGLSMLEKAFEEPKYVKSFNLAKVEEEDQLMDTIVPDNQHEFVED